MVDDISYSHDPFPPFESFPTLQLETFLPKPHLLLLSSRPWQTPPLPSPGPHSRDLSPSPCSICSPHHTSCDGNLTLSYLHLYLHAHIYTLILFSCLSYLHTHHTCMFIIFIHLSYVHAYPICMLIFAHSSYSHTYI